MRLKTGAIDAFENRSKKALLGPRFKVPLMLNVEEEEDSATDTQAVVLSA
jgi:hypothetical protein